LRECNAASPGDPHDRYDRPGTVYFGLSYEDEVVGTARLIRGADLTGLPTGLFLDRLPSPPLVVPDWRYSEGSQFGFGQRKNIGKEANLRLTGEVVDASMEGGDENFLLTLRGAMFWSLRWLPWNLAEPFEYPPQEGGPLRFEPMWPVTINLHELAAVAQWFEPYQSMFPDTPRWLDRDKVRPWAVLEEIARRNQATVEAFTSGWKQDLLPLPQLLPLAG
jgi:hypothetical protein